MSSQGIRVLLLGGHGKISLFMTPLMLQRGWHVTSMIRDASQTAEIESKGQGLPGKVEVLVESLDDVKTTDKAREIISKVKPNWIVWSAGAGGKGGASRTYAVDRDAAKNFIEAATSTQSVTKFLMISYIGSRRNRAPWFTDEDWEAVQKVNSEVLPDYAKAKVAADEHLVVHAKQRREKDSSSFQDINLRPGTLTDDPPSGKVSLGQTRSRGKVSRADVGDVAVRLLETDYRGYVDMLAGDESINEAVSRVVEQNIDTFEGENEDEVRQRVSSASASD